MQLKYKKHPMEINEISGRTVQVGYEMLSKEARAPIESWIMEHCLKHQRLASGTTPGERLDVSLKMHQNSHLFSSTVLSPVVHKKHAKTLFRRMTNKFKNVLPTFRAEKEFLSEFGSSPYFEWKIEELPRTKLQFVTIIHAVESLDVDKALAKCIELKQQISECVKKVPGASFVGAVETEVVNIKQIRAIKAFNIAMADKTRVTDEDGVIANQDEIDESKKEYRKLHAIEILSSHLSDEDVNGNFGQFLIHAHGILYVKNPGDIQQVFNNCKANPGWTLDSRQVHFKGITKVRNKKYKTLRQNFLDICKYSTKGSKVMIKGRGYLRYNMTIPRGFRMESNTSSCISMALKGGRFSLEAQKEYFDTPSLSHHEINRLALLLDKLMNLNKDGTGYAVSVTAKS